MKHKITREQYNGNEYLMVYEKKSRFSGWRYMMLFNLDEIEVARKWIANRLRKPETLEVYEDGALVSE